MYCKNVLFAKYYLGDEIEKDEGTGHVAHMREKRNAYRFLVGKPQERDALEDLSIDERTLKPVLNKYAEGTRGSKLAVDRACPRAAVNAAVKLRVLQSA
jgi:hypothetical protein